MEIPNKIKVGGHEIEVRMVPVKDIGCAGEYNDYYQTISLRRDPDTPDDAIEEAFLHEIIEAIKFKNCLQLDHTVLTVVSEGVFQVIRDNDLDFRRIQRDYRGA